jgi:UPF0042 nucleotide-binding protein
VALEQVVILTGMSGSGKTTALHALEDAGHFCVDNLPAAMLTQLLELVGNNPAVSRVAVAMDVRERLLGEHLALAVAAATGAGFGPQILYLDCDDDALKARFKTTRRRHPMMAQGAAGTLAEALELERSWLSAVRSEATTVINTTTLTVHELRRQVRASFGDAETRAMTLHLLSFGFRHGVPQEADFVYDVRFLDNPYFVEALRPKTGLDAEVAVFVLRQPLSQLVIDQVLSMLKLVLNPIEAEGRTALTLAIGCTGGHHRSVATVEALKKALVAQGVEPRVSHRDLGR